MQKDVKATMRSVTESMSGYAKANASNDFADAISASNAQLAQARSNATYKMPINAVPNSAVSGIMGSITNNFNNNNVNVNAASANAHEVAQIVLREINWMEGRNVK